MRSHKDSDSPSGYDREAPHGIQPRRDVLRVIADQERGVRKLTDNRWWRHVDALLPVIMEDQIEDADFPGCVW